jgi:hypothetical protein
MSLGHVAVALPQHRRARNLDIRTLMHAATARTGAMHHTLVTLGTAECTPPDHAIHAYSLVDPEVMTARPGWWRSAQGLRDMFSHVLQCLFALCFALLDLAWRFGGPALVSAYLVYGLDLPAAFGCASFVPLVVLLRKRRITYVRKLSRCWGLLSLSSMPVRHKPTCPRHSEDFRTGVWFTDHGLNIGYTASDCNCRAPREPAVADPDRYGLLATMDGIAGLGTLPDRVADAMFGYPAFPKLTTAGLETAATVCCLGQLLLSSHSVMWTF